jgi:Na+/proline symporter
VNQYEIVVAVGTGMKYRKRSLSQLDYEVIYSVNYINFPVIIFIVLIIMIFFFVFLLTKGKKALNKKTRKNFMIITICGILASVLIIYTYLSCGFSLKSGDYKLIEGKV